MKIFVLLSQPQFWLVVGVVGLFWFSYRLYRRVGRRCKCGRIWGVKRKHKIRLALDESISLRSTKGKLRWWIRRVEKETFRVCKCGWKQSMKVSMDPMSVLHAWWVQLTDKEQYWEDPDLNMVSTTAARERRLSIDKSLSKHSENDTPPVAPLIDELLEDLGLEDDGSERK